MTAGALPTLPLVDLYEPATIRLIPTSYHKPPVLSPLVDNDVELAILEQIEGLTSGRLKAARLASASAFRWSQRPRR